MNLFIIFILLAICAFFVKPMMNAVANQMERSLGDRDVAQGTTQPNWSKTEKMKAIAWYGPKDMRVVQVPKPEISDSKDAIIKVTAMTVCSGSDGHLFDGSIPNMHAGDIVGHEAMGIVESVGKDVTKFKVGDRVVISFNISCGTCEFCKKQQFTSCDRTNPSKVEEFLWGHRTSALFGYGGLVGGHTPGSQAQFVRVPFADINLFNVGNLPDEQALFMSDVVSTAYHALEMGDFEKGKSVVIWGLGPIGLAAARWCQIRGASRVIGIDLVDARLEKAKSFGVEIIDRRKVKSVTDEIAKLIPGGPDIAIEAVGFRFAKSWFHKIQRMFGLETDTPEIIHECMTAVKKQGNVSIIGDYAGLSNQFPVGQIMFKALTLRSAQSPTQKYFNVVYPYLQSGEFDCIKTFLSHEVPFDQVPKAYEKLHNKEDGFIKIIVKP